MLDTSAYGCSAPTTRRRVGSTGLSVHANRLSTNVFHFANDCVGKRDGSSPLVHVLVVQMLHLGPPRLRCPICIAPVKGHPQVNDALDKMIELLEH